MKNHTYDTTSNFAQTGLTKLKQSTTAARTQICSQALSAYHVQKHASECYVTERFIGRLRRGMYITHHLVWSEG